jgi:hypothetical protein
VHKKTLVIEIEFGGLGDHLFLSHIPRIAKQTGAFDCVYISNRSVFRSNDYKRLVWELNPYVDGFTDEPGFYPIVQKTAEGRNILDEFMVAYGLDDHTRFHEPEIYYQPKVKSELRDVAIYDPNYVSFVGDMDSRSLRWFVEKRGLQIDAFMRLRDKHVPLSSIKNEIGTKSLEDLCDIIASCKSIYCLTSGTATLAAALRKPVTVFYGIGHNTIFRHSALHQYIQIPLTLISKVKFRSQKMVRATSKPFFGFFRLLTRWKARSNALGMGQASRQAILEATKLTRDWILRK